jgi:ketosteroid isomerase-like protein
MKSAVLASCALLLLACEPTKVDPAPPASSSPAPTATPTAAAVTTPGKPDPVEDELAKLTKSWNDALAKRDAKALEPLYASNVRLYTVDMTREKAVKTKADILKASKDYTQSISFLELDTRKKTHPRALFNKKWTDGGKESQVRASLVFTKEDGKWVIKEESDAPSDQRRARAAQNEDGCESSVMKLASSTPEAMRILGGPIDPAKGHLSNGSRIGGGPPEQPQYSIGIHENHTDRIVTLMWIDVDPKTGAMTDAITNAPLQGSADLVERVKVACAAASR